MEKPLVKKPKWLKRLEKESWQAELVVSGVAIYGSLQLPSSLDHLAEGLFGYFSSDWNFVLGTFFSYSYLMAYIMILSFMFHFILRAFWIGIIGLNSAFPRGIIPEKSYYTKDFVQRFVDEYGFKENVIQKLDDFCSILFAGCAYFVLIFFVINIDLFIGLGIWKLLSLVMPSEIALLIIKVTVGFFLLCAVAAMIFNLKILRNTAIAKKLQYPCFILGNKFMLHAFFRTVYHIGFTFMTNFSVRKYYMWTTSFMMIVVVLSVFRTADSHARYFSRNDQLEMKYNRVDRMWAENYEDIRGKEIGKIISAIIPSERISGNTLEVFVPIFRNESELQNQVCGEFKAPPELSRKEARLAKRPFYMDCIKKYHKFYVNEKIYSPDIQKYTHQNKGEDGLKAYIPTTAFKSGINILKVEKWRADTVARTMQIPFYFEK